MRLTTRLHPALAILAIAGVSILAATIAADLAFESGTGGTWWFLLAFVVIGLLTAVLVQLVGERTRVDRALLDATTALKELGDLTESLGENIGSVSDLLDDFTQRVHALLEADWALLALTDEATGELRVSSVSGTAPFIEGDDIDGDMVPRDTTPESVAAPLSLGDQLGVIQVGASVGRPFRRADHDLLRLLADRASVLVEQARLEDLGRRSSLGEAQARSHLALLVEVSSVLSRALEDIRTPLHQVCDILLANFADACSIDLLLPDGMLERVAGGGRSPRADDASTSTGGDTDVALRRVLASRASELSFVRPDGRVYGPEDALSARMRDAGMTSWIVAPIRLRGLPFGTLTVATGKNRRGYRPSDQAVVDEVSGRLAIAMERSALYSDARVAGLAAERRADQLSNLLEAAIDLTRSLRPGDVLDSLVEQSARVLNANHSVASLRAEQGEPEVSARSGELGEEEEAASVSIAGPLVDHTGRRVGTIKVAREEDRPFEADEQALLGLVGRFASAALQNARLFEALTVREQRLTALFAASPLAILEFDERGAIKEANPAAIEMFGGGSELSLPADLVEVLGKLRTHTARGDEGEAELSLVTGHETLELWVSAAPLYRGVDALPDMLVVISDLTERKRLEEQLIDAHRHEAIAQLAGGIAHDFNNLLTVIIGYSDLLMRMMPENDEIAAMHEAGRLAAVITNQLLTLSRRQVVQPVIVQLDSACTDLGPTMQRLVGDSVRIETECDGDARIKIDPGQLEQVLLNLVLNSRDASTPGGRVRICTKDLGTEVAVVVSDEGDGMDAETIERCLEPFFTTKGRRGIGLGLATVQSIVQRASGRLEIESTVGEGTSISAIFPKVLATSEVPHLVAPKEHANVVLVDDDELIRRYASTVLSTAGFHVTTAADAEEAVAMMTEGMSSAAPDGRVDLLITDIVLPGMNGFELARRIHETWPGVARLLITGYAGTDTGGTDLEGVAVLPKPFAGDDLVRAANDALLSLAETQGSKR